MSFKYLRPIAAVTAAAAFMFSATVWADGDDPDGIGEPTIPIAEGTGVIAAGVGLAAVQPGDITVEVPEDVEVKQVILYWEGIDRTTADGDDTIAVNGTDVTGQIIGGPDTFYDSPDDSRDNFSTSYRADITDLGFVTSGTTNVLTISGMNFNEANNGAGVLVIIDDGGEASELFVRDGNDIAYIGWEGSRQVIVPQVYDYTPADVDRVGEISLFFGSVEGTISTNGDRPNTVTVSFDGNPPAYEFINELGSKDGEEWDTFVREIVIPADSTSMTIEAFSDDRAETGNVPASLVWVGAAVNIPGLDTPDLCPEDCAPKKLVFKYTGEGCHATTNWQHGYMKCWGDPDGMDFDKVYSPWHHRKIDVHYDADNGYIVVTPKKGKRLPSSISLKLKKGHHKLQLLKIQTSCKKPLEIGDKFGSLELIDGMASEKCCEDKYTWKWKYGWHKTDWGWKYGWYKKSYQTSQCGDDKKHKYFKYWKKNHYSKGGWCKHDDDD